MIKRGFLAVLLATLPLVLVHGGTTGKIAGNVRSADTGEPLIGVNIIVQGTILGAASDQNGYYVILNVPPGEYNITASAIGYARLIMQNAIVETDLTTSLDFDMRTEILAGEEVIVIAETRIIKQDVAGSQRHVNAERIESLPVVSVGDVLGLEAGVTSDLEIRGSADDEALFMVDGIVMRDARNSNPIMSVPLSAINEISVQKGGFGAEYTNVRSGVVNVVTKEGHPSYYSGTVNIKYSPPAHKYFGDVSPYDWNSFWLRPFMDDAVAWTGTTEGEPWEDSNGNGIADAGEYSDFNGDGEHTVWDEYTRRQYPDFEGWYDVSQRTLADADSSNDLSPTGAQKLFRWEHRKQGDISYPDFNIDAGFGGPVPFVSKMLGNLRFYASARTDQDMYLIPHNRDRLSDRSFLLKVTSDLSYKMKLTLMGFTGKISGTSRSYFISPGTPYYTANWQIADAIDRAGHTLEWRLYANDYWSRTTIYSQMQSAKLTHMLSSSTYYDLVLKRVARKFRAGPGPARDYELIQEIVPGYMEDEAPFGFESEPDFALGDGMGMGGSVSTYRDSSKFNTYSLDFNFSSQVTPFHEIATGLSLSMDDFDTRYGTINRALPEGNKWIGISHDPDFKDNPPFQKHPIRGVAYFEDKLETKGFIALLGLTAEYINANSDWYNLDSIGVYNADFFSQNYTPDTESGFVQTRVKPQFYLSPRLGISHPITENSKLYFNYGHYRQLPFADGLYRIQRGSGYRMDRLGDPSLPPEKTIAYELGFDQVLPGGFLLHLAGYYKDISNQRSWTIYRNIKGNVSYYKLDDKSYEDIRGLEIDLSKVQGRWMTGDINFEYRVSTSGYFDHANIYGTIYIYENPAESREFIRDFPPYQDRPLPRPRFKTNLAFHTPDDFGPAIAGQHLLGGWLVNLLGRWTGGKWVDWNPKNVGGLSYNVRRKPYQNVDLKASKTFSFGKLNTTFFVDISNVFNIKNFSWYSFHDKFDHDYYMYSLHLPEETIEELGYEYPGIAGDDTPGDVRDSDVEFVPIEWVANMEKLPTEPVSLLRESYYYVADSETYFAYDQTSSTWSEADGARIDEVLDTKAYIDMPNQTYFWFLNPRDIYFGIRISMDLR
jgi:outer membrane receptor protein involved in Fe transport